MKSGKTVKVRRHYEADFKQELMRMLASGRSAKDISESFGIGENLLYRWKRMATKKAKMSMGSTSNDKSLKLAEEVAKLRAENQRLKADRDVLKKALGLLSQSDSGTSMS
ncbi:Transposase [Pseudarcicella hirudinis]|uniref:Transposase n=1 Tax=Pseudarcicella hirudinis TaxID=1079859 RepID=A0A1I5X474_9BACT|nr:transposase [Pseudarcicella hirudinis]SFQ26626.1 Transposase [Pseudarcicella hirudinis]